MKLNDKWEIRQGPMGNDYALIEKTDYFSKKHQEWRTKETPLYYPSIQSLAHKLAKREGIDAVVLETLEEVKKYLEAVERSIVEAAG